MQGMDAVTNQRAAELLEQATEANLRARRSEALDLLEACADWPAPYSEKGLLLRAQVLGARDAIAGLQELASHADTFQTADGRASYFINSARLYMMARNVDAAEAMLDSVEPLLPQAGDRLRYQFAYARARLSWTRREYDPGHEDLAVALQSPEVAVRFDALNLRAWMHAGVEDYRSMMDDFRGCLRIYKEHGHVCGFARIALCLQSTLAIGYEMNDTTAEKEAEEAFETLEWTPEIRVHRFLCLRSLAWYAFLRGNSARAQWLFKDSKDDAPTEAWRVVAHVDRAYVARMSGNEAWAAEELHEAHALARKIEWRSTRDEERAALITLAVMFAPVDLGLAQRYLSTYIDLGAESLPPHNEASHDPSRIVAAKQYAAGRVQAMLGNIALATRNLEQAYGTFSRLEFDFRAALAAQELHQLTGDPRWLENAKAHAGKFPFSDLAQRLNAVESRKRKDEVPGLTPAQRQIAIAYCQGIDITELSRRFSRSSFTIGKQIETVYAAFGVRSRAALRDELHLRGML